MPGRRVVITGAGAITAAGVGRAAFHDAVWSGTSCIKPITTFEATGYPIRIGGQVADFRPTDYFDRKIVTRTPRNTHLAFMAATEAIMSSGLDMAQEDPTMVGSVMATTLGGSEYSEKGLKPLFTRGPAYVSPFLPTTLLYNGSMSQLSLRYNLQGITQTIVSEAAGGLDAIRIATGLIRDGDMDAALVGGCESPLFPGFTVTLAGLGLHARNQDDPQEAYRPFDRDGTGIVAGEGAGLLVLESEEHARARGATPLAEVAGYGATFDADQVLGFSPEGAWHAEALQGAMRMAGIGPADLDAVVAEGRGVPEHDAAEVNALVRALGGARVPVTCVKGAVGHTFSAAGALDAICALDILAGGSIPPVTNLRSTGGEARIDFVRDQERRVDVRTVLLGARGLGGVNLGLVLRRID